MDNKKILKRFYKDFNEDLADAEKCDKLQAKYLKKVECLRSEMDKNNETSSIFEILKAVDETLQKVNVILKDSDSYIEESEEYVKEFGESVINLESFFDKLNIIECTLQYYKVLEKIEQLNISLQKEMAKKDDEQCATIYANLCEINRHIYDSTATYLKNYLKEVILHWHNLLKEKFTKDLDEILKTIKWPFISVNVKQEPSHSNLIKLQLVVEYLLQIQPPEEIKISNEKSGICVDFPPLSLPLELMIDPLKKRFSYHFYGPRKTNRIDKPEWYFTQILVWIRDHIDFIEKWIQPVADRMGMHYIDTRIEFMQGLIQLAVEKLNSDIPVIQFDDFTFSHSVDEALGFDKELRETYNYPILQPGILCVLVQPQIFVKWLSMEKKFATEKMDIMLNSSEAFEPIITEMEDFKVTKCADQFVTLLQTITERYESLLQPGHRLQFLQLQLELLDDFRVRLLQLLNAEDENVIESRLPMICNTVYSIENVLLDWGYTLHFLNLYYYMTKNNSLGNKIKNSVFDGILKLYRHMHIDLTCTMADYVFMECRAKSREYRHDNWNKMEKHEDFRSYSLTPSACPIFEVLSIRLHQLRKKLSTHLFNATWKNIAKKLDDFLFDELILENRFNDGGAAQLKYDITRNLFPLFAQYTLNPEVYFIKLKESCILLNLSRSSASMFRKNLLSLEDSPEEENSKRRAFIKKQIGLINFTVQGALKILDQRTDLNVQRMRSID